MLSRMLNGLLRRVLQKNHGGFFPEAFRSTYLFAQGPDGFLLYTEACAFIKRKKQADGRLRYIGGQGSEKVLHKNRRASAKTSLAIICSDEQAGRHLEATTLAP